MNAKPFEQLDAEAARDIITKEFNRKITSLDIAERLGVGEKTLRRAFKKYFGTTMFSYQKRLRMEYARQLLEQGDRPVKQVSKLTGYGDDSSFSRVFRNYYGQPPSHFLGRESDAG